MNRIDWKVREKHETEVLAVMKQLGFLNDRNEVQRFDGAAFWPALNKAGHTATTLEDCACAKGGA